LAQLNVTVGDVAGNAARVRGALRQAKELGAGIVAFPELVMTGYPPEDLLGNHAFVESASRELEALASETVGLIALVGLPLRQDDQLMNGAAILADGRWIDTYCKVALPNYGVFDEKRYFQPGTRCPVYRFGTLTFGVNICEDIWTPQGVPARQRQSGARLLLNLSASPYHEGKREVRTKLLRHRARQHSAVVVYVNLVGGQDELVFDGDSVAVDASGRIRARAPQFEESLLLIDVADDWFQREGGEGGPAFVQPEAESLEHLEDELYADLIQVAMAPAVRSISSPTPTSKVDPTADSTAHSTAYSTLLPRHSGVGVAAVSSDVEEIYGALRLGLRDYVQKNGFRSVVIGVSGGIDSALTAVLAADAIGAENVLGVSMPSRFNSATSQSGARELAQRLGIEFLELPIEALQQQFLATLADRFEGRPADVTEENLQARIRGVLLMALSNKEGRLVLTTGNKSELAVGYCTLYGDMVGGFAPLADVPKTLIYRLSHHRNGAADAPIPHDTMTRPPSAELREGQLDQDRLPPYEVLDAIIEARVEREEQPEALVARGFDPAVVENVYRWIDANEYKRRQAAPGIKITPRAFGRDRRYPITNRYRWTRPAE